jgi:Flp pilus assembly pilin Flp
LFSETITWTSEEHMKQFLLDDRGDMVERGLIMAAIVVAAVFLWVSIGQKLAVKLGVVDASIGG